LRLVVVTKEGKKKRENRGIRRTSCY